MQLTRFSKALVIFGLAMISIAAYAGDNTSSALGQQCRLIFIMAQQITAGQDEGMRYDIATDLALYVEQNSRCGGNPEVVREIESLLNDHNDGVAARAAQALGYIGTPAVGALPALKRALSRYKHKMQAYKGVLLPSKSPGDAFEDAIERITGKKEEEKGSGSFFEP